MTKARDIITLALRDSGAFGIGQQPRAEDVTNSLKRLNWMLALWQRKRWLVYHLVTTELASTGAQSYTVGIGGDFNIERPDKIEGAFYGEQSGGQRLDTPVSILLSREDYNRIGDKAQGTAPAFLFYDSAFPLGRLFWWPVPAVGPSLHITTKAVLQAIASLNTEVELPDEYHAAIFHNLVVRLRAAYRLPPDPVLIGMANDSLETIRGANLQLPVMQMPSGLAGGGRYNVFSDR